MKLTNIAYATSTVLALLAAPAVHAAGADDGHSHGHDHGHGAAHVIDARLGAPGELQNVDRVIEVIMTDNAYSAGRIQVQPGETVRFIVRNEGEFLHEFNLGTAHMHAEHQAEMAQMFESGAMDVYHMEAGAGHDDPNSVIVNPGDTGQLIWTFNEALELQFACNIPGHYQSGMVGTVEVAPHLLN